MSDATLIAGVGDEVVLFVGFLVLSGVSLVCLSVWQRRRTPAVPRSPPRERHAPQAEEDVSQSSAGQPVGTDGLRHRSHVIDDSNRGQSDPEPPTPPPLADESGRGTPPDTTTGEEETIWVRLIQAGGPEHAQEVCVTPRATVGYLRRTYFSVEVAEHRPVKFIYQGRVISDDSMTLLALNIGNRGAMHVHVGRPHPPGTPPQAAADEALDLSRLFVPLFGLILGIVWVAMLAYPHIFTFMTKFFLFLLSLGYAILAYASVFGN